MLCGAGVRDPYDILGVPRNATESEIRTAFRRLAAEHHPDRNPGDPDAQGRFTEVNAAYQILCDGQKRAAYDRYGAAAFERGMGPADFVDLGNLGLDGLFGDLLGAFGIRTGDRGDLRQRLPISFEESILGCTKEITYQRVDSCERCSGSGGEPGSRIERCAACAGRGRVRVQQGVIPIAFERPCSACRGRGSIPATPCRTCSAKGLTRSPRTLEVTIPAGIEDGSTRLIEGAGNRTRPDRPAGDLELLVQVEPHAFFRRDGDDILCETKVSFTVAALGGEVEVPSITGPLRVRVPPATQPGSTLRIKGKGAPHHHRSGRGDQLVSVTVDVPTNLSSRAQRLLEELGHELGEEVQPQERTFVEKLRSLFD
jgi:molecular chaperone DnaJ